MRKLSVEVSVAHKSFPDQAKISMPDSSARFAPDRICQIILFGQWSMQEKMAVWEVCLNLGPQNYIYSELRINR